MMSDILRI